MKNSGVEWIGEIPYEWEVRKFKYFFDIYGGSGFKEEYQGQENGDFPFCKASDLNGTEKNLISAKNYVNQDLVDKESYIIIPKNSILVSKIGEALKKNHRKVNLVNCIVDNNCEGFVLNSKNDINYLYYVLKCIDMSWFDNGGTIPSINNFKLKNFLLPNCLYEIQQRIATYLDKKCSKIEETIQNQQQVIEKLKAYKQSLITEAVTGKVKIENGKICGEYESYKESGVKWIGKIPSGWEVGKFGRFAQIKSNLVDPNLYLEYPQIAPDNIGKGSGKLLDWQTVKDSGVISWNHLFFKGQIVYSKIRPTLNKLIIAPFDGLCSADMYPIETNMYKQFFVYMMLSQYFIEQVGLITRDRVKMPKINQNELSGILITVPTKEEQKEISDYLDKKCTAIDTAIEQKQKLIEKLTEYKKSLIYECVTGKKAV